jgi:hypothetical protein
MFLGFLLQEMQPIKLTVKPLLLPVLGAWRPWMQNAIWQVSTRI